MECGVKLNRTLGMAVGLVALLLALAACSAIPGDMRAFAQTQYPDAQITGIRYAPVSARQREAENPVSDAWCVEFDKEPSPIIVYRADDGLHVFEVFSYGDENCKEWGGLY